MTSCIRPGAPRLAIMIGVLAAGCASLIHPPPRPQTPPGIVGRRLSRAAAVEDIDTLLAMYERVHVNLFANVSRDSVTHMRNALVASLPDSVSRVDLWLGLDRIVAAFGDGHTALDPPIGEVFRAVGRGDMLLPIDVSLGETGELVVGGVPDGDSSLVVGDRVISINSRDADGLLNVVADQVSAEARALQLDVAVKGFAGRLWLNGVRGPFVVRTRNAKGVEREASFLVKPPVRKVTPPAVKTATADGSAEGPNAATSAGFRYHLLPDRVGVIDFYSMESSLDLFRAEIAKAFAQIAADSVRALVIDLRRNGGGNSLLGDALLAHLNDLPYRQDSRKDWRMSREFREYLKASTPAPIWWFRLQYLVPKGRRLFSGPDGRIVTLESPVHSAKRATPFFSGPVCMLIGPATFSSATDLAAAVKDFHLATLVGEETGGRANSFGEVYPFELPNSRLIASVSSSYSVRAGGDTTDHRGVLPDIEARRTADDVRAKRDPVLERAKTCPARPARR